MNAEFHAHSFESKYISMGIAPKLNYIITALFGNDFGVYGFSFPAGFSNV